MIRESGGVSVFRRGRLHEVYQVMLQKCPPNKDLDYWHWNFNLSNANAHTNGRRRHVHINSTLPTEKKTQTGVTAEGAGEMLSPVHPTAEPTS